jgi:hypothetical protein
VAGNKKQLELYAHPEIAGRYYSIMAGNINERLFAWGGGYNVDGNVCI